VKNLLLLIFSLLLQPCLQNSAIAQKTKKAAKSGIPIPWEPIKETDILWKKRIWREINVYERNNAPLHYNQTNSFATILLNGIKSGAIKAYSNDDISFTSPLSLATIDTLIQCNANSLSILARTYLNNLSKHSGDQTLNDTSFISSCSYPQ
jgi:hypothetical protein